MHEIDNEPRGSLRRSRPQGLKVRRKARMVALFATALLAITAATGMAEVRRIPCGCGCTCYYDPCPDAGPSGAPTSAETASGSPVAGGDQPSTPSRAGGPAMTTNHIVMCPLIPCRLPPVPAPIGPPKPVPMQK